MQFDKESRPATADEVSISDEMIAAALEAVRARIVQHEQQRAQLDRLIAAAHEEERLLRKLLGIRRGEVSNAPKSSDERHEAAAPASSTVDGRPAALQAVVEELTAAGKPLHISELMRLLEQRRIAIPGAGTQANLIIHLRRDKRLVRPSRGMYALASSGLEDMSTSPRRRRKKRVRVTAKAERTDS